MRKTDWKAMAMEVNCREMNLVTTHGERLQ